MKVTVCIPTMDARKSFLNGLLDSLDKQTFKDFKIQIVENVTPVGESKRKVVELALKDNPQYICMIDDDDYVLPTYLEKVVERLDRGDIDWCFTWGIVLGIDGRSGWIYGEIQPPEEMISFNHQPAWISAKADIFKHVNYDGSLVYAEDMDLWLRLYEAGYRGDVIKENLYMKNWHENSVSTNGNLWSHKQDVVDKYLARKNAPIV
jgi:glycosyltransferase involved in cell wall biosynthesis